MSGAASPTRLFWGGSRLRPGLLFGAWMVVLLEVGGTYQGPLVSQIVSALVGGTVTGALTAWYFTGRWPAGNELDAPERAEVAQAVTRGESPQDRRLAHATLQLADLLRDNDDRQRHDRWFVPALALGMAGLASYVTVAGRSGRRSRCGPSRSCSAPRTCTVASASPGPGRRPLWPRPRRKLRCARPHPARRLEARRSGPGDLDLVGPAGENGGATSGLDGVVAGGRGARPLTRSGGGSDGLSDPTPTLRLTVDAARVTRSAASTAVAPGSPSGCEPGAPMQRPEGPEGRP